jgi:hypothetical protein
MLLVLDKCSKSGGAQQKIVISKSGRGGGGGEAENNACKKNNHGSETGRMIPEPTMQNAKSNVAHPLY